ncbi:AimR family lysis-lysogeny pheromone receptor [Bacillus thuringiensis]|uniref:AimR family lysis-lysogeny pheromone receptor n=1 Tax=Bacillus thuringiensis TaxID=1428 RepID=UPI0011A943FD|nr:AimR family lysis-lysogeny pheromone receptor [Bacillus thuringiensis]
MEKVMHELLTKIEAAGFSRRQFAIKLGVCRETFRKGIAGESEMDAEVFLKAISYLDIEIEMKRKLTRDYFASCNQPSNLVVGLIYSQVQGEYLLMSEIIHMHKENASLSIYFTIYKLFNKRNKNELRGQALYKKIGETQFSANPHVQVMVNILYMLALADKPNNNAIIQYVDEVESNLELMEEGLIKNYLRMFADERIAYMHLWRIELEQSRDIFNAIIKSEIDVPMIKCTAICGLGEGYQVDCPKTAEALMVQATESLDKINVTQKAQKSIALHTTLAHVRIHNNINVDKIDVELLHPNERATYEYLFGDRELGLSIFEELKKNGFSPFQLMSYSICTGDMEGIKQALLDLELAGLSFYGRMYKIILNREGVMLV